MLEEGKKNPTKCLYKSSALKMIFLLNTLLDILPFDSLGQSNKAKAIVTEHGNTQGDPHKPRCRLRYKQIVKIQFDSTYVLLGDVLSLKRLYK